MADDSGWDEDSSTTQRAANGSNVGLAVALAALAALGAGIAIQQLLERRLSKPELARLKFYRYLRERGHLES
jgi:F0F1-type ATP synthase membrane subunit c/vacuolar-type H+-ATPase subunit K